MQPPMKEWSPVIFLKKSAKAADIILSHNNPCFPCKIAITNFLILYTCEIRFYDIIDRTVHMFYIIMSSCAKFPKHGQMSMFCLITFSKTCLIKFYHNSLLLTDPICIKHIEKA